MKNLLIAVALTTVSTAALADVSWTSLEPSSAKSWTPITVPMSGLVPATHPWSPVSVPMTPVQPH
ncbi:MAG TPA: hypothetical protein VJB02_07020 [Coxiellaceae bacterium]|nr:hypothetical protein [Coxiellaceae bacterium]